jgi:hypothetical protein
LKVTRFGHRLTRRLAEYVAAQAQARSCRGIALEVGLDERTVRTLVRRAQGTVEARAPTPAGTAA